MAALWIHVSQSTAGALLAMGGYHLQRRGTIPGKVRLGQCASPAQFVYLVEMLKNLAGWMNVCTVLHEDQLGVCQAFFLPRSLCSTLGGSHMDWPTGNT